MSSEVTIPDLLAMKREGRKIVSVTAYDYTFSRLLDRAGVDLLLVGDSLGMVIQGHKTTLSVTLDEMIYHVRAVKRGAQRALVVGDLPFGSFHGGLEQTVQSAVRMFKEGGCHAVKLEGGGPMLESIRHMSERGMPVMGHVGLTPQSVHAFGGFRVQGRGAAAERVMNDALAVAEAGAFCLVLEGIPHTLARRITEAVSIPTIGIGAGPECDGQVLVLYDLLGLYDGVAPRFVKRYMSGAERVDGALKGYLQEVREGRFPAPEHCFEDE
ncbi:MAG: 3-methyl-2-oxobutanoate hydroxymethyltransferase [Magnetococcales bacterium]|nr:3-methyl-2-oxobutanoate hydroxymethyltransferase [Magnetococcales bacterium]